MTDFYDVLGVGRNASPKEIKHAYRKLAKRNHPDREGGSEEKMQEINRAYQVLSDPHQKARYDRGEGFSEKPRSDPESRAFAALMATFVQVISQTPAPLYGQTDFIARVRDNVHKAIRQQEMLLREAKSQLPMVKGFRKRVKGGKLFDQAFESMERQCHQTIKDCEENVEVAKLQLKLLEGYSMETDERWADAFGRTMDPIAAHLRATQGPAAPALSDLLKKGF